MYRDYVDTVNPKIEKKLKIINMRRLEIDFERAMLVNCKRFIVESREVFKLLILLPGKRCSYKF